MKLELKDQLNKSIMVDLNATVTNFAQANLNESQLSALNISLTDKGL